MGLNIDRDHMTRMVVAADAELRPARLFEGAAQAGAVLASARAA
jgi:hypothetical protein